jgi:UDP-N-acetylmuramoylalanine--D-glutamate ligase
MIAVVGMARSGLGAARLLCSRGFDVWATDSHPSPALEGGFRSLGIPCETGGHSVARLMEASEIVVSPGVPPSIEPLARARDAGIPIVSELELACRYLEGKIAAITGSNGKTTTTALVAHVLDSAGRRVEAGGNIGRPVSDMVAVSTPETTNVIEVSSFQLEGTREFRPDVAVLLNVTPDHLDRHTNFDEYRRAKFRIFRNQRADDVAILNRDDPRTWPPPVGLVARKRLFGRSPQEDGAGLNEGWLEVDRVPVLPVGEVPLRGAHNLENVLAAMLVADACGIDPDAVRRAVGAFRPVEHRLETIAKIDGVLYVNDSKATNVDSAVKAVEAFVEPVILIAGGLEKGADFRVLARTFPNRVRGVITLGRAAPKIQEAMNLEIGDRIGTRHARDMVEAVSMARELAREGDVVLLAPACASFDMYENFEARGRAFRDAVLAFASVPTGVPTKESPGFGR